jgi:hypothetical protein
MKRNFHWKLLVGLLQIPLPPFLPSISLEGSFLLFSLLVLYWDELVLIIFHLFFFVEKMAMMMLLSKSYSVVFVILIYTLSRTIGVSLLTLLFQGMRISLTLSYDYFFNYYFFTLFVYSSFTLSLFNSIEKWEKRLPPVHFFLLSNLSHPFLLFSYCSCHWKVQINTGLPPVEIWLERIHSPSMVRI